MGRAGVAVGRATIRLVARRRVTMQSEFRLYARFAATIFDHFLTMWSDHFLHAVFSGDRVLIIFENVQ